MTDTRRGFLERVVEITSRYSMFERGQRAGIAVSGGADSVCLLHALFRLAPQWNLKLHVLHLDHRLRGTESRKDAEFVGEMAASLGLPYTLAEANVAGEARERGENLEQTAREARLRFFREAMDAGAVERVALGHTRDDQAETVLFRFLRGCGPAGLAGILPVTREGLVRPLLWIPRAAVRAFLQQNRIPWREDASNRDPAFSRNRIRHQLLPALARDWNPGLTEALCHMAVLAREEEEYWTQEVEERAAGMMTFSGHVVLLPTGKLARLPRALSRRLLRHAIAKVKGNLAGVEFLHVEAILEVASGTEGSGRVQIPGIDAMRSFDWLRLAPPGEYGAGDRDYSVPVDVPGAVELPRSDFILRLDWDDIENSRSGSPNSYNQRVDTLDWERLPQPLLVRNWRPGDAYEPLGADSPQKIKLLFQNHRIPLWERRGWPVLAGGGQIVWSRRFGAGSRYLPSPGSSRIVRVHEIEKKRES